MSYLLPCRPLQQQITVLVAQRVVRPLQIIAVRHNKTPTQKNLSNFTAHNHI